MICRILACFSTTRGILQYTVHTRKIEERKRNRKKEDDNNKTKEKKRRKNRNCFFFRGLLSHPDQIQQALRMASFFVCKVVMVVVVWADSLPPPPQKTKIWRGLGTAVSHKNHICKATKDKRE